MLAAPQMTPMENQDIEDALKLQALQEAVAVSIRAIERGDYTEFQDSRTLKAYLRALPRRN